MNDAVDARQNLIVVISLMLWTGRGGGTCRRWKRGILARMNKDEREGRQEWVHRGENGRILHKERKVWVEREEVAEGMVLVKREVGGRTKGVGRGGSFGRDEGGGRKGGGSREGGVGREVVNNNEGFGGKRNVGMR